MFLRIIQFLAMIIPNLINHHVEDNEIYFKNRNGLRETLLLRAMSGIVEVDCKDSCLKLSTYINSILHLGWITKWIIVNIVVHSLFYFYMYMNNVYISIRRIN